MKKDDIDKCAPERLAELMDAGLGELDHCGSDELAALLRHQLSVPVAFDLGGLSDEAASETRAFCCAEGLTLRNLDALFAHPRPPVGLLESVKCYAKACRQDPDSPIPEKVAVVLYFASVASALVRRHRRISELDDAALRRGIEQVLEQPWLDAALRDLLQETLGHLQNKEVDP